MNIYEIKDIMSNEKALFDMFVNYIARTEEISLPISKQKVFTKGVFFDQRAVAGLTRVEFFTGTPAANQTNLASFVRPEGEHFMILGIKILDGVAANVAETDWLSGANAAAIKNSTFDFINNTETELQAYPSTQALENLTTIDQGMIWLDQPILWLGQNRISVPFTYPIAPAVVNQNQRVELYGYGLIG